MKHYILTEEELRDLLSDQLELNALNYVGVSAWEGYNEAYEKYIGSEKSDFNVETYLKNYKQIEDLDVECSVIAALDELEDGFYEDCKDILEDLLKRAKENEYGNK